MSVSQENIHGRVHNAEEAAVRALEQEPDGPMPVLVTTRLPSGSVAELVKVQ